VDAAATDEHIERLAVSRSRNLFHPQIVIVSSVAPPDEDEVRDSW